MVDGGRPKWMCQRQEEGADCTHSPRLRVLASCRDRSEAGKRLQGAATHKTLRLSPQGARERRAGEQFCPVTPETNDDDSRNRANGEPSAVKARWPLRVPGCPVHSVRLAGTCSDTVYDGPQARRHSQIFASKTRSREALGPQGSDRPYKRGPWTPKNVPQGA